MMSMILFNQTRYYCEYVFMATSRLPTLSAYCVMTFLKRTPLCCKYLVWCQLDDYTIYSMRFDCGPSCEGLVPTRLIVVMVSGFSITLYQSMASDRSNAGMIPNCKWRLDQASRGIAQSGRLEDISVRKG